MSRVVTPANAASESHVGRGRRIVFRAGPGPLVFAVATVGVVLFPFGFGQYLLLLATLWGVYTLASFGLTVLTGHTGMYNLGYAGLLAIGAYTYVVLAKEGLSPILVYLGVIAVGVLAGALLGLAGAWLGEFSFAIVTFGTTVFVVAAVEWAESLTGGLQGIVVPPSPRIETYFVVWAFVGIAALVMVTLLRGWVGMSLHAVRDDETAAEMFGVPVSKVKFLAVLATSILPTIAGAGYAQAVGYVSPQAFIIDLSLAFLIIVIIGGLRSLWGALLGSALWIALPELTTGLVGSYKIIFGAIAIIILLWRPQGLVGVISAMSDALARQITSRRQPSVRGEVDSRSRGTF